MGRGKKEDSKMRLLAVAKMLNEGRKMSTAEIKNRLDLHYDIQADRKTIYSDVAAINRFIPIESTSGKYEGYRKIDVGGDWDA